ncbi:hypothetical protein B0T14DRAFT_1810 [Immersiella caudata]|uniref:Uncharacterized protein n=1 Tax=Immersiella caudata TaxID=314043 RepID=A0AA39XCD4_9PEZI|nr:hypothetical protein B0T14DRAFT_1810 [Immersiella caudata]
MWTTVLMPWAPARCASMKPGIETWMTNLPNGYQPGAEVTLQWNLDSAISSRNPRRARPGSYPGDDIYLPFFVIGFHSCCVFFELQKKNLPSPYTEFHTPGSTRVPNKGVTSA